jgi:LPXTG-motif cell wall-anchored protein
MASLKQRACAPLSEIRSNWALVACASVFLGACSTVTPQGEMASEDLPPVEQESVADAAPSSDADQSNALHHGSGMRPYRESRFPQVSAKPENRGGYWMNGYYFVRSESGYEELSQLIYGRTDRAALLSQWNSGRAVLAGSVVYYNSPFRPDDASTMKVLAEDFNLGVRTYTVEAGDTLSGIAQRQFGSLELWREIAALNRGLLSTPDLIEIGQVLRIQPSALDTLPALNQFIAQQQEKVAKQASAQSGQVAKSDQALPPPADDADFGSMDELAEETAAQNDLPPTTGDPRGAKAPGFSLKDPKVQTQALMVLGVLVLAAAAFVVLRRRRQARELEDAESGVVINLDTSDSPRTGTHF